jgi:hypothetical protein
MALIENAKGRGDKQSPSGYTRLFGIQALGNLMSRVQGAVISSGNELENLIWERVNKIDDLDAFLDRTLQDGDDKIYVARKEQIKKSQKIHSQYEPDFLGFNPHQRRLYIVEVKDGDQFDTKKSAGEHATLHNFRNDVSSELPYSTEIYMCCFNSRTRDEIYSGLKGKFSRDEVMTGKELSVLFDFEYDEICKIRTADQQTNLEFFIKEILHIPAIKNMIVGLLKNSKD